MGSSVALTLCGIGLLITYYLKDKITLPSMKRNYFSDKELMASATAKKHNIDNTPTPEAWLNLHALRDNTLNPAREEYGKPVYINCAYRCPRVNTLLGGEPTSQHLTGEAADITTKSRSGNQRLFEIIVQQGNYDQLIWEGNGSWIHVSYSQSRHRGQILAQNTSGKGYTNITNTWQNAIA